MSSSGHSNCSMRSRGLTNVEGSPSVPKAYVGTAWLKGGRLIGLSDDDEDAIVAPSGIWTNGVAIYLISDDLDLLAHWPTLALALLHTLRVWPLDEAGVSELV